jgi:hypothetical protein
MERKRYVSKSVFERAIPLNIHDDASFMRRIDGFMWLQSRKKAQEDQAPVQAVQLSLEEKAPLNQEQRASFFFTKFSKYLVATLAARAATEHGISLCQDSLSLAQRGFQTPLIKKEAERLITLHSPFQSAEKTAQWRALMQEKTRRPAFAKDGKESKAIQECLDNVQAGNIKIAPIQASVSHTRYDRPQPLKYWRRTYKGPAMTRDELAQTWKNLRSHNETALTLELHFAKAVLEDDDKTLTKLSAKHSFLYACVKADYETKKVMTYQTAPESPTGLRLAFNPNAKEQLTRHIKALDQHLSIYSRKSPFPRR